MIGIKHLNKFQKRQFNALLKAGEIDKAWKYAKKCLKVKRAWGC